MTIDLKALRELCELATPGPWSVGEDEEQNAATLRACPQIHDRSQPPEAPVDVVMPFGRAYSDAAFVAAARTAVPELLDLVGAKDAEIAKLQAAIANLRGDIAMIQRLLDYDLSDLPPGDEHRTCNTRLYQANMRAFRACMEATKED